MNVFFTADLHFGHGPNQKGYGGIIFHTHRPFPDTDSMDNAIIAHWNSMVGHGDHVWILGDFAWRNHVQYMHRLSGKKFLVKGSHDMMNTDALRLFAEVHAGMAQRSFDGKIFTLTHCAMRVWERSHYGSINLYGHSHGRLTETDDRLQMDVGVDVWDYKPVPLELIMMIMKQRKHSENQRTAAELEADVAALAQRNAGYRATLESEMCHKINSSSTMGGNAT